MDNQKKKKDDMSLLDEVDFALNQIVLTEEDAESLFTDEDQLVVDEDYNTHLEEASRQEIFALFEDLLWSNIQPLRDCVHGILANRSPGRYYDVLEGVLHPLRRAVAPEALNYTEMRLVLEDFQTSLDAMRQHRGRLPLELLHALEGHYQRFLDLGEINTMDDEVDAALDRDLSETPSLASEFRKIRNIGPKRVQRLITAGLADTDAALTATPEEMSESAGIPLALAKKVQQAARQYAIRTRRENLLRLLGMARQMQQIIGDTDEELALPAMADALEPLAVLEGSLRANLSELLCKARQVSPKAES